MRFVNATVAMQKWKERLDRLEELKAEKARLDGEIKKYRSEGNMDMVNSLRKQRRIVRGKINKLK